MSGKAALEAELPELGEPWIASVGAEPELQEVVVEGGDLRRLQLDRDAAHRLLLVALHHFHSVRPAITAERGGGEGGIQRFWACFQGSVHSRFHWQFQPGTILPPGCASGAPYLNVNYNQAERENRQKTLKVTASLFFPTNTAVAASW